MSLNELILDQHKPWLNIRVNDLTVDGDTNISGDIEVGGTITADSFATTGGDTISNFVRDQTLYQFGGSLYQGDNSDRPQLWYQRIGNQVIFQFEEFTIPVGDLNPAGGLLNFQLGLIEQADELLPNADCYADFIMEADGVGRHVVGRFNSTNGLLFIAYDITNATPNQWPGGLNEVRFPSNQSWVFIFNQS